MCASRGDNPNTVKKKKDANYGGLKHKYEVNSFQVRGGSQEEEDDTVPQTRSTQDSLVSTRYKNTLVHSKMKALDVLRGRMIPSLKVGYATASTLADRCDSSKSYHILKERSQVTREQVLLWGSDCMLWGSNQYPIDGITHKRQDQGWIYTLARNSCTASLNVKIETA